MAQLQSIPEHPLPMPPSSDNPHPKSTTTTTNSSNSSSSGRNIGGNSTVKSVHLLKQAADDVESLLKSDPVTHEDVVQAVQITRPSSDGRIAKYSAWQKEFGST